MWLAIGNLGDAALTIPLALVCFGWLIKSLHGWRIALGWLMLLATGMFIVGATKILYAGCGIQIRPIGFRVISGHTMLAAAVWPMACLLVLHNGWNVRAALALLPGLALAAIVAVARVFVDAHTVSEVIAGWMLGVLVMALLLRRWKDPPILPPWLRPLAAGSVLLVSGLAYGRHAPIQTAIETYSPFLCTHFR
jgi:membrane-associated phospholipid phosphatase